MDPESSIRRLVRKGLADEIESGRFAPTGAPKEGS